MKKIYLLCFLLGMPCLTYAQVVTITDHETGHPLELVTIMSENPRAFATTNAKGKADVSKFEGADEIVVRILSYKTEVTSYAALESQQFQLSMVPSSLNIDEVVISASRWNETTSDIPSKVITISSKKAALQNPQTAADLLSISGKVFVQKSQQGGGSPMIRGFATNRLLYTVDGVRMNTAIFRSGNIQNVISLDPFATEHTEVFFGPGSVIYGSDAVGGVMSFQTLTPQFSLDEEPLIGGKALARFSSANEEKTAHFDVNVGWKKWAMVTSISSNDYGNLKMGSNGPDDYLRPVFVARQDSSDVVVTNDDPKVQTPSGYSQINLMQKLRFKPNDQWDFQYGFHYSETSDYGRYDRHLRTRDGLPRYGEWYYGPQKWMMNNLNVVHSGQSSLYDQMTVRMAQQSFEESRISRNFNNADREIRVEEVEAYSVNVDFVKETNLKNKLFYGVEVVHNDVNSTGVNEDISTGVKSKGPSRYPNATWASYAVYATDQYRVSNQLTLQGGLRYNLFKLDAEFDTSFYPFPFTEANLDNGALTGSAGLVYRPTDEWVLSTNFATAFRSPNVDDVGKVFDSEPGSVVVPNPDLEAEYSYNIDLGVTRVFGDVVKVDVTGYYTSLKNAMVRRNFTLNGMDSIVYDGQLSQVQAIQNAAVTTVYGLQAGIEINLPSGFGFSTDYNIQKGEEELDNGTESTSRHAPPSYGVSRLTYGANNLSLQLYAMYSSERGFDDLPESEKGKTEIYAIDGEGNPYSPGWYTLNFNAMYQFTDHLTVSAGVENLTDQRYRSYSSGISAPGRNFVFALRANF